MGVTIGYKDVIDIFLKIKKTDDQGRNKMALKKIPLEKLQIGHYVCLPLGWTNHPFLLNNFKIKNSEELLVLKQLPLKEIEVNLAKSDPSLRPSRTAAFETQNLRSISKPTLGPEETFQRQQKIQQRQTEEWYNDQISLFKNTLSRFHADPTVVYSELLYCIQQICEPIWKNTQLPNVYLILNSKNSDNLFTHSMNVCALSILIAKVLGFGLMDGQLIALAAMIQDIGFLRVPHQIRHKTTSLTSAELNFYKAHVGYSIDLLRKAETFPADLLELVAQHHERLDGSGYPKGLSKKQISKKAQLLQIADHYDWLVSPNPWQKPLSPQLAIASLLKNHKQFNPEMAQALANALGIYPPGTLVQLSNQDFSIVAGSNPANKLKPYVKRLHDGIEQIDDLPIESLEQLNLKVTHSINQEDLSEEQISEMQSWKIGYFFARE
ncbi:MAG: Cyclic di-GMP phosphodiesterase [Candidatus Celerinatantimonas neptuna]|nr:MAG: Cyclic di-GMP phosphodiesterase [Candidatus Celerinatantimonas neptuna]